MQRLVTILAICITFVAVAFAAETAQAQTTLTEAHIERIKQGCVTTQTTLRQLHASDALMRVNRGRLYEQISDKLMAPLNSRITLGRFESLRLTATTLEYDRQREVFATSYRDYEESMSRTIKLNCAENPVEFYDGVQQTREKRQRLHEDTETITTLLRAYKAEFESFASEFEKANP